jgi:hypothetical protein
MLVAVLKLKSEALRSHYGVLRSTLSCQVTFLGIKSVVEHSIRHRVGVLCFVAGKLISEAEGLAFTPEVYRMDEVPCDRCKVHNLA